MMRREPELTQGQRQKLDIINRSGDHLLTLIDDVLEIARIAAGRVQFENMPFDLGAMLRDFTKQLQTDTRDVTGLAPGEPEYRVLIVEDQLENQLLLEQLLASIGFRVKVAENGAQGIELFRSWQPHFIWMDRRMPELDGMEATRRIRELPGGKEVKIVAVTASTRSSNSLRRRIRHCTKS